jgi:hypothetical protein
MSVALAMVLLVGSLGCSSKSDSTPNPDMKVPTVPKGDRKMPGEGGKKT